MKNITGFKSDKYFKSNIRMRFLSMANKKIMLLLALLACGMANAQTPTYQLLVTNEVLINPKNYQFDVFLLRTGNEPLELSTVQFGLGFDVSIVNGGTLTASIVGNSELQPSQVPVSVAISGTSQVQTTGSNTYRFFNCAARTPGGPGSGTMISNVNIGCNHPGTRVATFKLTSTEPFASNSHCNHLFSISPGSGRTNTLVNAYIAQVNTAITNTANHLGYNSIGSCDQNISLNGCVAPVVSEAHVNATCNSSTGTISISNSSTGGPFTYLWSDGNTNKDRSKLKSGTYIVTVANSGGCTTSMAVVIQGLQVEAKIIADTKISCFASCDGILKAQKITGVAPVTYLWSNGASTQKTDHLCSGTYTVTVTDAKGCTGMVSFVLHQPAVITPACTKTEITSPGANDGTLTWKTKGGTTPYTYLWSDGYTTGNRTNIATGTYTITITDAHGCNISVKKVWKNAVARLTDSFPEVYVSIFPNPSAGRFTVEIDGASPGHYLIEVMDIANKLIIAKDYELEAGNYQVNMDLSDLPKGVYMLNIKGDEIKEIKKLVLQ